MELNFKFCNRDNEFQQLQDSFIEEVIKRKKCLSFLIQGRLGVGKSRLIKEFINRVNNNKYIASKIQKFRRDTHVIEYNCSKEKSEPYLPFMEVTKQIKERTQRYRILKRIGMLLISFLPFHDVIDDLQKLGEEIQAGETDEAVRTREIKVFQKYLRVLRKKSKRAPLIINIQNVQWIDRHSLELLQTLIDDEYSLWGMIILEANEVGAENSNLKITFNKLYEKNKLKRLSLKPMQKGFEIDILENLFGSQLFTSNEFEHIYTLSEGLPGNLENYIRDWTVNKWLFQKEGEWKKIRGFEDKIKPPYQKLLDLIITFLQDGEISPREQTLINNFAQEWDIDRIVVANMIDMIFKCRELGYDIEARVHSGSIGEDAFVAYDKNRNKFILEYVPKIKTTVKYFVPRDIHHPRLLPSKNLIKSEDGIIILNEYFEGKTLRDIEQETRESHITNTLETTAQIADGLAELHRNQFVHGFIRPESIIKTNDGDIRIAAIDALQLNISDSIDKIDDLKYLSYFSPEQIDEKTIDARSDIFSFGILLFEMLTGELPFKASSKNELKKNIRFGKFTSFEKLNVTIPDEVQHILVKCLQPEPGNRYQTIEELLKDLNAIIVKSPQQIDSTKNKWEEDAGFDLQARQKSKQKRWLTVLAPVSVISVLILAAYFFFFKNGSFIDSSMILEDTIVINSFETRVEAEHTSPLNAKIVEYLLIDDLHQSTDKNIITRPEFDFLYNRSEKRAAIEVIGLLVIKNIGFEIDLTLIQPNRKKQQKTFSFNDPSGLLTEKTFEMTQLILDQLNDVERKRSTFTNSWDAFMQFYEGEKAWERLETTRAKQYFEAALDIDPNFILAKLRLAQVFTFGGNQVAAQDTIKSIHSFLGQLSFVDSLKAEAMEKRLAGNLRGEIDLLRKIYDRFPTRKESAYEVAEAYYQLCDIQNAINYYQKALHLDENFARAHNHIGYCYSHLGEHEKALQHFRTYFSLDSSVNSYDSWGDGFLAAGKLDSAATAKLEGIKLDPQVDYLYQALCYIRLFQGRFNEASQNSDRFITFASGEDRIATGYFLKAVIKFLEKNYRESLNECLTGLKLFDSEDIVTRNHNLHWLLGLNYVKLNRIKKAKNQLEQMRKLIQENKITATNYRMYIYKYYLHLKAELAAKENNLPAILEIIGEFDGPIKDKVKDHTSPFDLAYFQNSFGEILMNLKPDRLDLAEKRFLAALDFNPNFAFAHYNLWQLYKKTGEVEKAAQEKEFFYGLWQNADDGVKKLYGVE